MRPKRELIRVVRTPAGELRVDPGGKVSGRGAYVCPSAACAEVALNERRLERALEVPVPGAVASELRLVAGRGAQAPGTRTGSV
jgi:predicted RNA-binding protein YlxR (DUF448 family)